MQILSMQQQLNSSSQQLLYSGRTVSPVRSDNSTVTKDNRSLTPTSEPPIVDTASTPGSDEETQDVFFNAVYSVGTIKRLLEQMSGEELRGWVDPAELNKALHGDQTGVLAEPAENLNETGVTIREWSYRYESLNADFSGAVMLEDGTNFSWSMQFAMSYEEFSYSERTEQPMQDPLVMSFNGQPVGLTGQSFAFALNPQSQRIQQLTEGQYYLAKDSNKNGVIDSGKELFGPDSGEGFAELAAYDEDSNGLIDQRDSIWEDLWLWRPDQSTLYSPEQKSVLALSLASVATPFTLRHQGEVQGQLERSSLFFTADKQLGLLQQIDLKV